MIDRYRKCAIPFIAFCIRCRVNDIGCAQTEGLWIIMRANDRWITTIVVSTWYIPISKSRRILACQDDILWAILEVRLNGIACTKVNDGDCEFADGFIVFSVRCFVSHGRYADWKTTARLVRGNDCGRTQLSEASEIYQ